ncbi:MAG: cupin domain-containing protein [Candidatus Bathyarchaeum sp.]|nr:MAG: cupin domain-containing protein [Candidatus Bathyarchaeum sp.]
MKPVIKKPTENEKKEAACWPIWEKEKSKFPWEYNVQETCLILEGKAVVSTPEGSVEFEAGDYVIFPEGLVCTWEIKQPIKKRYKFG